MEIDDRVFGAAAGRWGAALTVSSNRNGPEFGQAGEGSMAEVGHTIQNVEMREAGIEETGRLQ